MKRGTDSHASDVGHWLGMTVQEADANNPSLCTRETLGLRPYEIVSIRRSYDYGAGDGAAEPNNVPAAGVV